MHPDAAAFFPVPGDRSAPNELLDTGRRAGWWGVFFTMSTSIAVVNSVVAGAAAFVLLDPTGASHLLTVTCSVAVAVVVALGHVAYQELRYRHVAASARSDPVRPREVRAR